MTINMGLEQPVDRDCGIVSVDGALLQYVIEGSGIPTLVIGSARYYPRTLSSRLRDELKLVFLDVRHFAMVDGTVPPEHVSLSTYTNDIEAVRAHLGFDRVVVVGHSHHGNLALEYAKQYPERASHVVLIGSPPLSAGRTASAAGAYWTEHATESRKTALKQGLAALESNLGQTQTPQDAYVATYVAEAARYWHDPAFDSSSLWQDMPIDLDLITVFRGFFDGDYELAWDAALMPAPVLVVMGLHDYAVPHTLWDGIRPKLRNLTYHLFERSGHTPCLEEAERFDGVILKWLAQDTR